MANISLLSRLVNGVQRQVDLSTNTLVVQAIQINGTLLSSSSSGASGSKLVGDDNSYSNFTPTAATVKGALSGIDTALAGVSGSAITALTGDVSATGPGSSAATVNSVGGSSAANVHSAELAANAATSANTVSTIVKRDSSGNFSAGTITASLTGHASLDLALSGGTMSGSINMGSNSITNLASPTNPNDAVTKSYVDNFINATSWKTAALVATTANITLSGEQTIDGVTTSASRVLVKNQTAPEENGIYTSASGSWTRTADMDAWSEVPAAAVFVQEGTVNADIGYVCTSQPGGTLGTTAITFVQFSSAGAYSADEVTLHLSGGVFSVKNAGITETQIASSSFSSTGALTGGSGTKISVRVDNSTIDINGSNNLEVKALGIGTGQLAAGAVTPPKLGTVTDGVTLDQSGTGSTIEIKPAGVSATQLATGAFDQVTITGGAGTPASVASSPTVKFAGTAGQSFSANTTYALRYGLPQNSETAGRLYAADISTGSYDLFWVVGFLAAGSAVSSGNAITVIKVGTLTLGSSDTNFGSNDPGKALFLQSGGTQASTTAPSTSGQAVAKIGIALSTTTFMADISAPYVY